MKYDRTYRVSVWLIYAAVFCFAIFGCAKQPLKTVEVIEKKEAAQEAATKSEEVKKPQETVKQPQERVVVAGEKQTAQKSPAIVKKDVIKESDVKQPPLAQYHIVKKGESLWWIAKYKDIYNDPFLWPIIFETNKNVIENPDKIHSGQKLKIPRTGYTIDEIKQIRKKSGAPRPFTPPQRANPPVS